MRAVALSVLTLGLTGCLTSGVVQTAETAGKDTFQFAFEPGVVGASAGGDFGAVPSINLSARYGVSDKVDIGGRIGTTLIELSAKAMLTEPNPDEVQVSLAPHIGGLAAGGGGGGGGLLWLRVPLLIDVPVGQSDIVIGPAIRTTTVFGGSSGALVIDLGSSIGYAARVGDRSRIIPELGVSVPVVGSLSDGGGTGSLSGGTLFSFQVGLVLGGRSRSGE